MRVIVAKVHYLIKPRAKQGSNILSSNLYQAERITSYSSIYQTNYTNTLKKYVTKGLK